MRLPRTTHILPGCCAHLLDGAQRIHAALGARMPAMRAGSFPACGTGSSAAGC